MNTPTTGLDHCIVLVHELEAAEQMMRRLGFAPAPRGVHSDHMGTHNHCIMLERGYFEVMAVRFPTERNLRWRNALAVREGASAVALQTRDAAGAELFFRDRDIGTIGPLEFSRVVMSDGHEQLARFTTLNLSENVLPLPAFLCQHHTPELVWQPELVVHPNTANALLGAVLVAVEPQVTAQRIAMVLGCKVDASDRDVYRVMLGEHFFDVVSAGALATRYESVVLDTGAQPLTFAALVVGARDLDVACDYLSENGVVYSHSSTGAVVITPHYACGTIIELRSQTSA